MSFDRFMNSYEHRLIIAILQFQESERKKQRREMYKNLILFQEKFVESRSNLCDVLWNLYTNTIFTNSSVKRDRKFSEEDRKNIQS